MTFRGYIHEGRIELEEPTRLPDGTEVKVQPLAKPSKRRAGRGAHGPRSFWIGQSLDELARRQRIRGAHNPDDLSGDWPKSDSIADFLRHIRKSRG